MTQAKVTLDSLLGLDTALTVMGAYGRTYTTQGQVEKDWKEGKDFKIVRGPYFSIRDRNSLLLQGRTALRVMNIPSNGDHGVFYIDLLEQGA